LSTPPVVKSGFFDKLSNVVNLNYVLKVGGIIMFSLGMFKSWQHIPILDKFLIVSGPIAWYVGYKFNQIYK